MGTCFVTPGHGKTFQTYTVLGGYVPNRTAGDGAQMFATIFATTPSKGEILVFDKFMTLQDISVICPNFESAIVSIIHSQPGNRELTMDYKETKDPVPLQRQVASAMTVVIEDFSRRFGISHPFVRVHSTDACSCNILG